MPYFPLRYCWRISLTHNETQLEIPCFFISLTVIVKKAECWRIDAFKLWCWRRLLRVPWTARSHQSTLREINPEYSLEGLMLKCQYYAHLMQRADSLEKTLMLRKTEIRRKRGRQRMRWLDGITKSITWVWASSRRWWRTRKPGMLQSVGCKESDTTEQLNNNPLPLEVTNRI